MNRFWSKVDVTGPDDCWEWQASLSGGGYGQYWLDNRQLKAHRVAWTLENGEIPEGLCVCHHCDNPRCVNPSHLFLGTHRDNVIDGINKGRTHIGVKNGNSKLDENDVKQIRVFANLGKTQREIGRIFGISKTHAGQIIRRERWNHK